MLHVQRKKPKAISNVQGIKTDGYTFQNLSDELCLPSSEGLSRARSELIIVVTHIIIYPLLALLYLLSLLPYHASQKSHPK